MHKCTLVVETEFLYGFLVDIFLLLCYYKNMPEISRFLGIVIAMYFNDHNPSHFHVLYNEYDAEIEINR